MSTTVTYKGSTLTTVNNNTRTLKTAGKYMEGDVVLTDVSASAPNVWQDQDGYVHLDDEGTTPITVEALSVTQNGTYTATTGHAYSPVTVNVSGGGGSSASKKQINFIDYDGTILHSYTKSEWQSVTALPSNPSHTGLTAQGWNWTKAQIDAQLTAIPDGDVWVGQMYITTSGDTEIDVRFADSARLSPYLSYAVNGTITIDWGDNSTSTVTGTSLSSRKAVQHIYASAGDYTITIHVESGSWAFYGASNYSLLNKNSSTANGNRVYSNCVQNVRIGADTSIGTYAFSYCYSLASVTIPSGVATIGTNAFSNCYSLASVTIPSGVTVIGSSVFYYCYSLASVTMPSSVTSIGTYAFSYCYSLASVTIPSGVTVIGNNALHNCHSLASVTIPSGVTSIGSSAFANCFGVAEYHFLSTTPPTLADTNAFSNIQSDCVIYVPSASLETYKTASNWSSYASYMQGE